MEEALVEATGDDGRSARIVGFRAQIAFAYAGPGGALPDARAALERAERADDPTLLAAAIARVGQVETYTLDFTPGLLERGVAIEEDLDRALDFFSSPSAMLATRLMLGDELERARPMLERAAANAAQRGDEGERAWVLFYLMWVEWLAGRWQLASDYIAEAMELARQTQDAFLWPLCSIRRRSWMRTSAASSRRGRRPMSLSRSSRAPRVRSSRSSASRRSATSRSPSATWRLQAATCARFPDGCSRVGGTRRDTRFGRTQSRP